MSSTITKVAAIAATAALAISGAQGVANAQAQGEVEVNTGSLNLASTGTIDPDTGQATGSLQGVTGSAEGATGSDAPEGSIAAWGLSPDSGSLLRDANATGTGSFDTTGSLLGEPTLGSLAGVGTQVSGSFNVSNPGDDTGSVDTTGSVIGEPTTGSLAPIWSQLAAVLGTGEGITTILEGLGSSTTGTPGTGSLQGISSELPAGGSLEDLIPAGGSLEPGSLEDLIPAGGSLEAGSLSEIIANVEGSVINVNLPGGGSLGSAALPAGSLTALLPVALVGGSIAAGIAAAPAIGQALGGGIALPPLPEIDVAAVCSLPQEAIDFLKGNGSMKPEECTPEANN